MTNIATRQYIPRRLRRWGIGRTDQRLRYRDIRNAPIGVLQGLLNSRWESGIRLASSEFDDLGSPTSTSAALSALTILSVPNAARVQDALFETVMSWNENSSGIIVSMGSDDPDPGGFQVHLAPGGRFKFIARLDSTDLDVEGGALLQQGTNVRTFFAFTVDPFSIQMWMVLKEEMVPLFVESAPEASARWLPDAITGRFAGASDPVVSGGITTGPANGLTFASGLIFRANKTLWGN